MATRSELKGLLPHTAFAMAKIKKAAPRSKGQADDFGSPELPAIAPSQNLGELLAQLKDHPATKLYGSDSKWVWGEGNPEPELLMIGEAPGENEDLEGRPFVGRAGQLLDKMISAMKVKRSDLYLTNLVKKRPPENRKPSTQEIETSLPILKAEIDLLKPKVIVTLGATASDALLNLGLPMTALRGKTYLWNGFTVIPTFHPAYLLRNAAAKKDAWEDLKLAMRELGRN